jgi:hypothetical protein
MLVKIQVRRLSLSGFYSLFSDDLKGRAKCSLPVVFSATEKDRFQQKVIGISVLVR